MVKSERQLAIYVAKQVTDNIAYSYTEAQRSLLFDRLVDILENESLDTLISLLRRDND